ncbi:hypothetical protein Dsin_012914 [Dipteronia sinensis]|uniref:DUF4283 domain-containing protein n=1 Tax=Dipteronia sinensis TaxID=43782 RepID=A0AAE0AK72_9ROSI|nr:hypothetical protein Dsin_012914 [Dipteronia sinensis]
MFWDGSKLEANWLSKCAVGVLKGFDNVSSVNYRLINRGVSFSASYLGDKFILWKFESEDDCLDFINNRFYWDDCFSLMEKWWFSLIARARPVWINFSGVPLSCWNSEFFMKLGRLIGHPLAIHEGTLLRRRLDIGRLLVLIPFGFRCPSKIKVAGGYKSFILIVEEDISQVPCFWVEDFFGLKKDYQDISSYEQNMDDGGHEALKGVRHKSTVSKIQISSENVGRAGSRQPKTRDTVAIKQIGSTVDVGRAMATCQIITKEKKVSKGVGELCISKNALGGRCSGRKAVNVDKGPILSLAGAILNFNLLRGGNFIKEVSGGPKFSKLVHVCLEGCGSSMSEGPAERAEDDGLVRLVNGNIYGITSMNYVSPSVNTPADVQVSGGGLEGKVVLSKQDTLIDAEERLEKARNVLPGHDQSNKSRGRKKNHSVKRHCMLTRRSKALALDINQDVGKEIIVPEMKKVSWNLKEELGKVIKEIVRKDQSWISWKVGGDTSIQKQLAFVSLWVGRCLLLGFFSGVLGSVCGFSGCFPLSLSLFRL